MTKKAANLRHKPIGFLPSRKTQLLFFTLFQFLLAYAFAKNEKEFIQDEILNIHKFEKNKKGKIFEDNEVDHCYEIPNLNESSKQNLNNERKFIMGKCNPVLLIAGFLGVRLTASVNCRNLVLDPQKLYELRYFCGKAVCKEAFFGGYDIEEYTLWPALFNNPFKLLQDDGNKDNRCFAYFMRHFNEENDCPLDPTTGKSVCLHNKNIKVTFFGDTSQTQAKSECGTRAISRIVDGGYSVIPDYLINSPSANGFYDMIQGLKEKGYTNGFSMAGLPYDFRKFHLTNSQFKEKFEIMVEMLYRNTGKKVIVVAHSLGNLNVLRILNKENPVNSKIKRYIGMVPPFFGAAKAVEFFSTGSEEFRMKLFLSEYIDISSQAQRFYGAFTPVSYALTLKPKLHELAQSAQHSEFIEALKERFDLERKCGVLSKGSDALCDMKFISNNSIKFKKHFAFFPQFDSDVCIGLRDKIRTQLLNPQFIEFKNQTRMDIYENLPSYEGCELRIFDFLRCPFMKIISGNPSLEQRNFTLDDFHSTCFEDFEKADRPDFIFNHECKFKKNSKNCLLNFLTNFTTFDVKSFFSQKDPNYSEFPESLFINQTDYLRTLQLMTEKTWGAEALSEMDPPKVPTSIIYASYLDTKTNYIYMPDRANASMTKDDINYFGGDGTVATYSSLIPAMKWIYDNKKNNVDNHVQIVNYCSYLSNYKEFAFDFTKDTKSKEYVALTCECISPEGYDLVKVSKKMDKCSHSPMIADRHVIKYLYSMGSEEPTFDALEKYPKEVFKAFTNAITLNYEDICNKILHD